LQGDALDSAAWLRSMQFTPALVNADPWYGGIVGKRDVADVDSWIRLLESYQWLPEGTPLYFWGGIGRPMQRPLLEFALRLERETLWRVRDWVTWKKKRAYGKQTDYLFVREECLVLTLNRTPPKPGETARYRTFNVPLLDVKRGYAGYDPKHPAKSEFKRRPNVWLDECDTVWDETELLRGKLHVCHKAPAVCRVPIEVHTVPGDLVLDLYAGSGEVSFQADALGRRFVAVELDLATADAIAARLKKE
jgi:DNA modification methylase